MTLLVDVGNSAIKWALLRDGEVQQAQWQLHRGVTDIAARLTEHWLGMPGGAGVIACNVASDAVMDAVERATRAAKLGTVHWMRTQTSFAGPVSLVNGYRDPMQLGADRWHCMLGACVTVAPHEQRSGLVVVNAGTATTVDCIEPIDSTASQGRFAGRFVGGVIAPGVRLMLESLARGTARLPSASGAAAHFPDNTDAAITTGVLDAQAGLVLQIWQRFADRFAEPPSMMLTGGNAAILNSRLSIASARIEDNLVLRGLALRADAIDRVNEL